MTVGDAQDAPLVVAAPVLDRYLAGVASFLVALSAAVVALLGPMGAGTIVYRWRESSSLVTMGQDIVHLLFVAPLCVVAGILRLKDSPKAAYLLGPLGLYLAYFFLFYALGPEWRNPDYAHIQPTSQQFVFLFWICIAGGVVLVMDALSRLLRVSPPSASPGVLRVITLFLLLSLSTLALVWIKDVVTVARFGDLPSHWYSSGPGIFWLIKTFDLAVWIPLGFIGLYAFFTRPAEGGYGLLVMFVGFKAISFTALVASQLVMAVHEGPAFDFAPLLLFSVILVPTCLSYLYLTRSRVF